MIRPGRAILSVLLLLTLVWSAGFAVSWAASGPSPGPPPPGGTGVVLKPWTVMVYLDGDNNLEAEGIADMNEMEQVGSNADVDIVVQMDRAPGYDSSNGNWTDTRRFHVMKDSNTSLISSPRVDTSPALGELNMGARATLEDFVQWAKTSYPAQNYLLVLWDHGSGWKAAAQPPFKGVAYDDSSGKDRLTMAELRAALASVSGGGADPIEIVGFDACLMSMIEVGVDIRGTASDRYAHLMVGSEETEPGAGWPYNLILSHLTLNPSMTKSQLAGYIVTDYYASYGNTQTMAAVDLGAPFAALETSAETLAAELRSHMAASRSGLGTARAASQTFDDPDYIDLKDLAGNIRRNAAVTDVANAASAVETAVTGAVVSERHGASWPGANGLTVYFPATSADYSSTYDGSPGVGALTFTQDTEWDEMIGDFFNTTAPDDEPNLRTDVTSTSPLDTTISRYINPAGDIDWFRFNLSSTADVTVTLTGLPGDYDLYLYDTGGIELQKSANGGSSSEQITLTDRAAGNYYVKVIGYGGAFSASVPYALRFAAAVPAGDDAPDTWTSTSQSPVNADLDRLIGASGDVDWFRFVTTGTSDVTVTLANLPANYDLYVYGDGSSPSIIGSSANSGTTSETVVLPARVAGTYYVRVVGATPDDSSASQTYRLRFTSALLGDDAPDTQGAVTSTSPNDTDINRYIGSATDIDWFKFHLSSASGATVRLDSLPADYDVELCEQDGTLLAFSNNAGTAAELMSQPVLPAGDYCVKVYGYGGAFSTVTPYRLRFEVTAGSSDDAPDLMALATTPSPVNSDIARYIDPEGDVDWFKFVVPGTSDLHVTLTGLPDDYDLYFCDSSGTELGMSNNAGTTSEDITLHGQPAGTYYAKVIGFSGAFSAITPYTLRLATSASTADDAPNVHTLATQSSDYNADIWCYIDPADDVDWFKFVLPAAGNVRVTLDNLPKDYDLSVFYDSGSGEPLNHYWEGGTTPEIVSLPGLSAGTYYVKVEGYLHVWSATQKYRLRFEVGPSVTLGGLKGFSPNGDGKSDVARLDLNLDETCTVSAYLNAVGGGRVATISTDETLGAGSHQRQWDGTDDFSVLLDQGRYRWEVQATNAAGYTVTKYYDVALDTQKPGVSRVSDSPDPFRPGDNRYIKMSYTLSDNLSSRMGVTVYIYNSANRKVATLAKSWQSAGRRYRTWRGKTSSGAYVRRGRYHYRVIAEDYSGNARWSGTHYFWLSR